MLKIFFFQPIRIQSYGTNQAKEVEAKLFEHRQTDLRYFPLNMKDLKVGYETSMKKKEMTRTIKVIGAHLLFVCLGWDMNIYKYII